MAKSATGLALDAKNHILFACCHNPQTAVILSADDGKIITSLPIGNGVDGAAFNPNTMEALSSQRDGTLTVIKENSPTSFEVAQNVQSKPGARSNDDDSIVESQPPRISRVADRFHTVYLLIMVGACFALAVIIPALPAC